MPHMHTGILDYCGCSALQHQAITSEHISSWVSTVFQNNSIAKEGAARCFRGVQHLLLYVPY